MNACEAYVLVITVCSNKRMILSHVNFIPDPHVPQVVISFTRFKSWYNIDSLIS